MPRYIDAGALIEKFKAEHDWSSVYIIEDMPLADVVEVVHGEWIPIDVGDCCYRCSVCNFVRDAYLLEEGNYCPHCGAKMDLL